MKKSPLLLLLLLLLALIGVVVEGVVVGPSRRVLDLDGGLANAEHVLEARGVEVAREGALGDFDAVVVRSRTRLTREALATGARGRLVCVGRAGVGVDNIDIDACRDFGIVVLNTPGASSNAVAELAISHVLASARHTVSADRAVRAGDFARFKREARGTEVRGSTLGIVGYGRIGRAVERVALALGMRVKKSGAPLADIFETCDFVSVHCALSDRTRNLIDRDLLRKMKGGHLVNTARGGVVREDDVVEALEQGWLATYATDVFEVEPPPPDHPLLHRDDVLLSPHIGAATVEAQARVSTQLAASILAFFEQGTARCGGG
ncbi:hypothetical protein CTAYLR_003722 [Chrysophaeum taylorii]|uniref:D-3-phosphoglycerate dehydrogenase n=1 Tax=Chrysophaeum taylorii TaxID=2483200 RepID=A0AAD7UNW4_9STRA|nr:hypothetical protein CTAYLR_003722 [Chrysophaeum taylorii]